MIKPVTAMTLLTRGTEASRAARSADLQSAVVQGDNCAQLRVVDALQSDLGGEDAVLRALQSTAQRAGATLILPSRPDRHWPITCAGTVIEDALRVGRTQWTVGAAARFAAGLRNGSYPAAASARVLEILRKPKRIPPGRFTAPVDWGAGRVFAASCWRVAYASGWGGQDRGRYVAGQLGTVDLAHGGWAAFAVAWHPRQQPSSADPGAAGAPRPIEDVLASLKGALKRQFPGTCS
jgi:hypothetical protein